MNNMAQWGIVGMGVMGTNLSRNFSRKGLRLALFNRKVEGLEEGIAEKKKQLYPELNNAEAFEDLKGFILALETPRKILIMLPSGKPTENFFDQLLPLIKKGDIIIDGANSHYQQTNKWAKILERKKILFLGIGISGGKEGALNGASLMVGGNKNAYELIKNDLFQISAKNRKKKPCCCYFGYGGAGHYVKMVHNGIEYAEMQLISEVYALCRSSFLHKEIQHALNKWNKTESRSYLLEITASLLMYQKNQIPFIEMIEDQASNNGSGAWATSDGIELGYPNNMMASALYSRYISSFKADRVKFARSFSKKQAINKLSLNQLKKSYDLSRWVNHHQGFEMLALAANHYKWKIDLDQVAEVWSDGCIIKSELMNFCISFFKNRSSLLLSNEFKALLKEGKESWKKILQQAIEYEVSVIGMQSAWSFFSLLKTYKSSANIIQAQRDYFGAHGVLIIDGKKEKLMHGPWS